MVILNQASQELYRREADEVYPSLTTLWGHCRSRKENSRDLWISPETLQVRPGTEHRLSVDAGVDGELQLNDRNYSAAVMNAGRVGVFSKADWIPSRMWRLFLRSVET